jgi:hypothetical protein
MVRKLEMLGHVKGCPNRRITSYYSWPVGKDHNEVEAMIKRFKVAFHPLCIVLTWMYED